MTRWGFVLKVRKDCIEEYRRHHQMVWPEMLEALKRHGYRNYSLFLRQDGLVFGYVETDVDLKTARAGMAGEEVNRRWQGLMASLREPLDKDHPDVNQVVLEEVFHMD